MPTLNAIFRLSDEFSAPLNRITRSSEKATSRIERTVSASNKLNNRISSTGNAVNGLSKKIGSLIGSFFSLENAKKAMDTTDQYTSASSRLSLITNNLQKQKALQNEVFSAAERSRGSYSNMSNTVSKLGSLAGGQFGSTENIVKFAETMQKMFKISGISPADQTGAMSQVQKAIGTGSLQGDDFSTLTSSLPMVENAVAQYTGSSIDKVRQLSSEGKLSSGTLIDSILNYSKTVDQEFNRMPMTFSDVWNQITNKATEAFAPVMTKITDALNSPDFQKIEDSVISGIAVAADAVSKLMDVLAPVGTFISDNWSIIEPIILGVASALAVLTIATQLQTAAQFLLNFSMLANPIVWFVLIIVVLITAFYAAVAAVNQFAGTTISATGLIIGGFQMGIAVVQNLFIALYNTGIAVMVGVANIIITVAELFANGFNNPIGSAVRLFVTFGHAAIQILEAISSAFDAIFHTQITSKLKAFDASVSSLASKLTGDKTIELKRMDASQLQKKYVDPVAQWKNGYDAGKKFDTGISNIMEKLKNSESGKDQNKGTKNLVGKNLMTNANPFTVQGTGSNGSMNVNMADQDLQYLRDLAEKDYVNKFSSATLAPNISVKFTGAISNEVDTDKMYMRIGTMLKEEIATAAEGAYV